MLFTNQFTHAYSSSAMPLIVEGVEPQIIRILLPYGFLFSFFTVVLVVVISMLCSFGLMWHVSNTALENNYNVI